MSRDKFHDRVVQALGQQIGSGVYAPGEAIPIEGALAEQFAVSRVVVREAIKILAAKGLVDVRTRTGTRVRRPECWQLLDAQVLGWCAAPQARSGTPDLQFIADLIELRRIVEPAVARLAARRATPHDVDALRTAFHRLAVAAETDGDYLTADLHFHATVLRAGRNQFLSQLENALAETLRTSIGLSRKDPTRALRSLPLHAEVLRGIELRDPDVAAGAVERLVELAAEQIARAFGLAVEENV